MLLLLPLLFYQGVSSAPGVSSRLLYVGVVAALLLRQPLLRQGAVSAAAVNKKGLCLFIKKNNFTIRTHFLALYFAGIAAKSSRDEISVPVRYPVAVPITEISHSRVLHVLRCFHKYFQIQQIIYTRKLAFSHVCV
jgi:hypothetical protein